MPPTSKLKKLGRMLNLVENPPEETFATPEDRLASRLEKMMEVLDDNLSKKEIADVLEKIIEVVVSIKDSNDREVQDLKSTLSQVVNKLDGDNSRTLSEMKGQVNSLFVDERIKELERKNQEQLDNLIETIEEKLSQVKNGKDGARGEKGDRGLNGSPDTAKEIKDKLETLTGEERLDASAIKGLEKVVKKHSNKGTSFVVSRGAVVAYDLSSQLNGVTSTFSMPSMWRVISIHLSSFPNVLRPTVDYTNTSSSITFTSEINPATSLATGQTCIVVYAQP